MTYRNIVFVCFMTLVGATAGPMLAATLTFDEIVFSSPYDRALVDPDRYINDGVLLTTDRKALFMAPALRPHTPPNALFGAAMTSANINADSDVIADFVSPGTNVPATTSLVSFRVVDVPAGNGGIWSATIFNIDGHVIGSISSTEQNPLVEFNHPGIRRLIFSPSNDYELLDTLTFAVPIAVPEANALALLPAILCLVWRFRSN